MNHLSKTVSQSASAAGQNQTPFFDFTAENFPVAVIAGGKGLSSGGWQAVAADAQATIAAVTPPPTTRGTVTIGGNAKVDGIISGVITGDIAYHARDRDSSH